MRPPGGTGSTEKKQTDTKGNFPPWHDTEQMPVEHSLHECQDEERELAGAGGRR